MSSFSFIIRSSSRCPLLKPSQANTAPGVLRTSGHSSNFIQLVLLPLTFYACLSSRKRMPPKKKEEEKKILLGRPGNNLKSGIVSGTGVIQCLTKDAELWTLGWACKCWQIYIISSHNKVLAG